MLIVHSSPFRCGKTSLNSAEVELLMICVSQSLKTIISHSKKLFKKLSIFYYPSQKVYFLRKNVEKELSCEYQV